MQPFKIYVLKNNIFRVPTVEQKFFDKIYFLRKGAFNSSFSLLTKKLVKTYKMHSHQF